MTTQVDPTRADSSEPSSEQTPVATKSIPPQFQWKTQAGVVMDIHDMDDQHLANSIKMLERNAQGYKQRALAEGYATWSILQGEQAQWDIESDIDQLEEMPALEVLAELIPAYKNMKRELRRRTKVNTAAKKSRKEA